MDSPEHRLIVYGSLAPGGANAFLFQGLEGTWHRCLIQGHMGRWRGFKSFHFDPEGPEHQAWLFYSLALPRLLPDLDDFEGEEYRRIVIPAKVGEQWVQANIYEGEW